MNLAAVHGVLAASSVLAWNHTFTQRMFGSLRCSADQPSALATTETGGNDNLSTTLVLSTACRTDLTMNHDVYYKFTLLYDLSAEHPHCSMTAYYGVKSVRRTQSHISLVHTIDCIVEPGGWWFVAAGQGRACDVQPRLVRVLTTEVRHVSQLCLGCCSVQDGLQT